MAAAIRLGLRPATRPACPEDRMIGRWGAPAMVLAIAFILIPLAAVFTMFLLWRATRHTLVVGGTKGLTVSRQWLMEHQADD